MPKHKLKGIKKKRKGSLFNKNKRSSMVPRKGSFTRATSGVVRG